MLLLSAVGAAATSPSALRSYFYRNRQHPGFSKARNKAESLLGIASKIVDRSALDLGEVIKPVMFVDRFMVVQASFCARQRAANRSCNALTAAIQLSRLLLFMFAVFSRLNLDPHVIAIAIAATQASI